MPVMPDGESGVMLELKTAERVLKATRIVEGMSEPPGEARNKPRYSTESVVVPRSGPDGDGFYTCDIYRLTDAEAGTYTQVSTGQKARLLPATL